MKYHSLRDSLLPPCFAFLEKNFVKTNKNFSCAQKALGKGAYLILAPASMIVCAIDIIIGIGGIVASLLTLGKNQSIYAFTFNHLSGARNILVNPFVCALKIINFKSTFASGKTVTVYGLHDVAPDPIGFEGDGYISNLIIPSLKAKARKYSNSNNCLENQILSRLIYVRLAISSLFTRIIDGVISIPATTLALLAGGRDSTYNNLASRTLQAPSIIKDLSYCAIKVLNPRA